MKLKLIFITFLCVYASGAVAQNNVIKLLANRDGIETKRNIQKEGIKKSDTYKRLESQNQALLQEVNNLLKIIEEKEKIIEEQKEKIKDLKEELQKTKKELENQEGISKILFEQNQKLYEHINNLNLTHAIDSIKLNLLTESRWKKAKEYAEYPPGFINGSLTEDDEEKHGYILSVILNTSNIADYYESIKKTYSEAQVFAKLNKLILKNKGNTKIINVEEIGNSNKYLSAYFTPKEYSNFDLHFKTKKNIPKGEIYPIIELKIKKETGIEVDLSLIDYVKFEIQ